jgi:rhamnose utilization protein RhaD (predicted bifunctional aldolase and dehydrogenase)
MKKIIVILIAACLCACSTMTEQKPTKVTGNPDIVNLDKLALIAPNKTTKADIRKLFDKPATTAQTSSTKEEVWTYEYYEFYSKNTNYTQAASMGSTATMLLSYLPVPGLGMLSGATSSATAVAAQADAKNASDAAKDGNGSNTKWMRLLITFKGGVVKSYSNEGSIEPHKIAVATTAQ